MGMFPAWLSIKKKNSIFSQQTQHVELYKQKLSNNYPEVLSVKFG